MSKSRVVSSVLATTILLILATATMSFALTAVDSAGKVIGTVVGYDFGEVKVVAKLKTISYIIMLGRDRIYGSDTAYYTQPDCGGVPYIIMDPAERIPIIVFPSVLAADGRIYIMRRNRMSQVQIESYWDYFEGTCENFRSPSSTWVTPLQPVGTLGTTFKAPYDVK